MTIKFAEIPTSLRVPGIHTEFNLKQAARGLATNLQEVLLIGQRLKAYVEPSRFQGGTLNDAVAAGTYTGAAKKDFIVQVSTAAAPDKFKYSTDGGVTWSAEIPMDTNAQALEDGVTILLTVSTGHALLDEWRFSAWPAATKAEASVLELFSAADAADWWGYGSIAHIMVLIALAANPYAKISGVALDDAGASVAATGDQTLTGTATSPGLARYHIGRRTIEAGISTGDTAHEIALALQGEMEKFPGLPTTFAVDALTGKINYVAKNKGAVGNDIPLGYEVTAKGITVATTAMNGGSVDPDVDTALSAVAAQRYHIIATPYADSTSLLKVRTHLDAVSGPMEQRPGIAAWGMTGALAAATTLGAQINSGRMQGKYLRYTSETLRQAMPYEIAASYCAMKASEEDPAQPLNNREVPGIPAPAVADRLIGLENNACLYSGISPLKVGPGEKVQVVRAISSYIKNPEGVDDESLLDITSITTMDYTRESINTRLALRFPASKLSDRTPAKVQVEIEDVLLQLDDQEILENVEEHMDKVKVERNAGDKNRLDWSIPNDVVNGLHIIAGRMDMYL